MTRRFVIVVASLFLISALQADELYHSDDRESIIKAARQIIVADPNCALITIDADHQPRARTVTASPPSRDMTIWITTRASTRKVQQIKDNAKVTLYFNDDVEGSYVSVMGTASLYPDLESAGVENWFPDAAFKGFYPNYPDGFVLIEVKPTWLEVMGRGIKGHPETWRPQAVKFE